MTRHPSFSSISAQIVRFLYILPHPKPLFMHLAYLVNNPNNNVNTQKVEMQLLDNRYIAQGYSKVSENLIKSYQF